MNIMRERKRERYQCIIMQVSIFFIRKLLISIIIVIIGSSKAMERDMVVDMVTKMVDKGVNITKVVADEDTTTFSHLRTIHNNITKINDRNHNRKTFFLISIWFAAKTQIVEYQSNPVLGEML